MTRMDEPVRMAMVGCGGMGTRHLHGLAELARAGLSPFDLVGAVDPNEENAASFAAQANELLGRRPETYVSLEALGAAQADVLAVDVCTEPRHHHSLGAEALRRGWHVMVEKPMGLTLRACDYLAAAAAQSQRVLAVSENYRRDPVNRLARALLAAQAIGKPRLVIEATIGGADRMVVSPWRHLKTMSGVLLDVGVHYADVLEYLLGPVSAVTAQTRLHEPLRQKGPPPAASFPFYRQWFPQFPEQFPATAEDAAYALLEFENGLVGQYTEDHAGHGSGFTKRAVYGSSGSMELPRDRTGAPISLTLDGGSAIDGQHILDLAPDYRLDRATAILFGGERVWRYDLPFVEVDRKIIAVEYADFAAAIVEGHPPEVGIDAGRRAVALSYAILESGAGEQRVQVRDVLDGRVDAYQHEIDADLGLPAGQTRS